jgi:hypothetical protein
MTVFRENVRFNGQPLDKSFAISCAKTNALSHMESVKSMARRRKKRKRVKMIPLLLPPLSGSSFSGNVPHDNGKDRPWVRPVHGPGPGRLPASGKKDGKIRTSSAGQAKQMQ